MGPMKRQTLAFIDYIFMGFGERIFLLLCFDFYVFNEAILLQS